MTEDPNSVAPECYPVHSLDNMKGNQCWVNWTMQFNDVLDPQKLNDALSRVLQTGDWKKLAGRLYRKVRRKPSLSMCRTIW